MTASLLLIYNIMDEVEYNAQGNRVKMVKPPDPETNPNAPEDKRC